MITKREIIDRLKLASAERLREVKLEHPTWGTAPDLPIDEEVVDLIFSYICDSDQADGMQEDDLVLLHHLELMYDFLLYAREVTEQ